MGKKKKVVKGAKERGNGWQIDTTYKGIRIQERASALEAAENKIREAKLEIDRGVYLRNKRQRKATLGKFLSRYLRWCEKEGQKAVADKQARLQRMVDHFGEDTCLIDLTPQAVEAYKAMRLDSFVRVKDKEKEGRKVAPATVNRELAYFRHMLSKAVDWGLIDEHPMRRVKQLREKNRRLRYLTSDEVQALLQKASPYLKSVIKVALNTGLRYGELMHLRWEDLDWKAETIEIGDQKNGEISHVPMNRVTLETLRAVPRRIDSPYVFARKNGNPPIDFRRRFAELVKAAEVTPCRFHDLRHTFASHLAMGGVDLFTVKELMRHKTISMTLRYAHLSPEHRAKAIAQLDFLFPGREAQAQ